ncbi:MULTISPECIES: flagellar basal body-associated FliL family protein [Leeia]|uniref:Flagellar protein FliL n=1 Tax=Leeia aquatica TaxID=2725557 RepID=A0A847S4J3_9NEIS|nr:flagellar basal body-associated FliL family protein [Leeia aquatica]NLR74704.1 flagellar basal body-associated FliL family protein [Leeia aquatica]
MKKIIIIVVAVVLLLGGVGGGVWFYLSSKHKPTKGKPKTEQHAASEEADAGEEGGGEAHGGEEAPAEEEEAADEEHKKPPVFEKIDRFVVNVDGNPEKRGVMSVEIQAELGDPHAKETLNAYKPKIQSEIILMLGSQKFDELSTPEGKKKLQKALQDKVNEVIGVKSAKKGVKSIAFTSLILEER